jgi:hypothetical protein
MTPETADKSRMRARRPVPRFPGGDTVVVTGTISITSAPDPPERYETPTGSSAFGTKGVERSWGTRPDRSGK